MCNVCETKIIATIPTLKFICNDFKTVNFTEFNTGLCFLCFAESYLRLFWTMSTDIGPILAKCSGGNERHLLTQLLHSASKVSLQNYINSLSSKCDQYQRVECLRTVLQHSTELCQDNGDKLLPILNRKRLATNIIRIVGFWFVIVVTLIEG